MLSITKLFESTFRRGAKEAGRSIASGAGLGVRGAGQFLTGTGQSIHDRFSKTKQPNKQSRKT